MSPDPAAFHRALLAGSRSREWRPVPVAAAAALCGEAVLSTGWPRETVAWVVLAYLGGLGLLLLGLRYLPQRPRVSHRLGPWATALAASAAVLGRVLLLAACVSLAAALLTVAVPALTGHRVTLAVGLLAVVVVAVLAVPGGGAGRPLRTAAEWCGAAVLAVAVVAAVALADASPGVAGPRVPPDLGGVHVLVAGALGGMLIRPALPRTAAGPRPERQAVLRILAAAAGVLALLALAASVGRAGATNGLAPALAGAGDLLGVVLAVVLAVVVLGGAAAALSGSPLHWRASPAGADAVGPTAWSGGPGPRAASAALGLGAGAAVVVAAADVGALVAAYTVTVLLVAVLALGAGRRLWRESLETLYQREERRRARHGRAVTGAATLVAAGMLAVVAVRGWAVVPVLVLVSVMMWGVSRHDRELSARLAPGAEDRVLPTVVRAFVVATALDRPALRAVTCARALRATSIEVLTVPADEESAARVREQWAAADLPVPLVELAAPPGQAVTAVVEHVRSARRVEPSGLAVVYLPEVTAPRWWRRLLVGRGSRGLRRRLIALPGTVVTTVPWTIEES